MTDTQHRATTTAEAMATRARAWRDPEADFGLDVLAAHYAWSH